MAGTLLCALLLAGPLVPLELLLDASSIDRSRQGSQATTRKILMQQQQAQAIEARTSCVLLGWGAGKCQRETPAMGGKWKKEVTRDVLWPATGPRGTESP